MNAGLRTDESMCW